MPKRYGMNRSSSRFLRPLCACGAIVAAGAILGGCATGDPYAFQASGYFGFTWLPISDHPADPPYPSAARAAGIHGRIAFAVVLDGAGAVDHRTLSVLFVSDARLLAIACPWMVRTRFRIGDATAPRRAGPRLSLIELEYVAPDTTGRLVKPDGVFWDTLMKISDESTMADMRHDIPQCP